MLSKHLTHVAGLLSVCYEGERQPHSCIPGDLAGEGLTPRLPPYQAGPSRTVPEGETGETSQQCVSPLFLLLLFEFVIKGGSEGWKETLQESKFILDSGERKINLSQVEKLGEHTFKQQIEKFGGERRVGRTGHLSVRPSSRLGVSVLLGQQYTAAGTPILSRLVTPPHALLREASADTDGSWK